MDVTAIEADIIQFLKSNVLAAEVTFTPTTSLSELGIDSFSIVEIILFIERKYAYVIPESKLIPENFSTVHAIAQLVTQFEEVS